MIESTRIIGERQFQKAWVPQTEEYFDNLFDIFPPRYQSMYEKDNEKLEALEGPVQFAHQFVDMPKATVEIQDAENGPKTVRDRP